MKRNSIIFVMILLFSGQPSSPVASRKELLMRARQRSSFWLKAWVTDSLKPSQTVVSKPPMNLETWNPSIWDPAPPQRKVRSRLSKL